MDPEKIETLIKWKTFKTVKGVQKFLGFADFYRKFIKKKSQLVMPLTNLMKKKHKIRLVRSNERGFFETEANFRERSLTSSIR